MKDIFTLCLLLTLLSGVLTFQLRQDKTVEISALKVDGSLEAGDATFNSVVTPKLYSAPGIEYFPTTAHTVTLTDTSIDLATQLNPLIEKYAPYLSVTLACSHDWFWKLPISVPKDMHFYISAPNCVKTNGDLEINPTITVTLHHYQNGAKDSIKKATVGTHGSLNLNHIVFFSNTTGYTYEMDSAEHEALFTLSGFGALFTAYNMRMKSDVPVLNSINLMAAMNIKFSHVQTATPGGKCYFIANKRGWNSANGDAVVNISYIYKTSVDFPTSTGGVFNTTSYRFTDSDDIIFTPDFRYIGTVTS